MGLVLADFPLYTVGAPLTHHLQPVLQAGISGFELGASHGLAAR